MADCGLRCDCAGITNRSSWTRFAAVLDDAKGGRFSICPDAPYDSSQVYVARTNVLQTRFRSAEGELKLTDIMVVGSWRSSNRRASTMRGHREKRGAFTRHYDTGAVDAALLLIPPTGIPPCAGHRVAGTISVTGRVLPHERAMPRYGADDGLAGKEKGFMICLFWYLHCLILHSRVDEVDEYPREAGRYANHLGLWRTVRSAPPGIHRQLPQAYSHIG